MSKIAIQTIRHGNGSETIIYNDGSRELHLVDPTSIEPGNTYRPTEEERGTHLESTGYLRQTHNPVVFFGPEILVRGRVPESSPRGVGVSIQRTLEISPRVLRLSAGYLYVKPMFRGIVELQFGASNPRIEIIRRTGGTDIELNNQVSRAVIQKMQIQIEDQQLRIIRSVGESIVNGNGHSNIADIARLVLGQSIADSTVIHGVEIIPLMPPNISITPHRASASVAFVRIIGEWQRNIISTTIMGIPTRLILTGAIQIEVGLKAGGWTYLASLLGRHFGSAGAAAELGVFSVQLGVRGIVNGLLGIATPLIVITGTPIITLSINYFWAGNIQSIREEGERIGLANQFATGYINRIFYPNNRRDLWYRGQPSGSRRTVRQRGIDLAERHLQNTQPNILQQVIYHELDYNQRNEADISDIIFRYGERLHSQNNGVRNN